MNRRAFTIAPVAAGLLAGWGALSRATAQSSFKLQAPTALQPTPQGWTFLALADGNLAAVNRRGAAGKVEVHILDAGAGYQRFAMQVETAMPAADDNFDFVALPNRDIAGIHRGGAGGRTEIHVLDASKSYKAFRMQAPTALPTTDRRWAFGADGDGNLVGVNRLGMSGKTEIHVVDADKKYARFKLQAESALQASDSTWDFGVLANGDVLGINRRGESGKTEFHVLDAAKDYKRFKLQMPSPLAAADNEWKFAVRGNGDVMAVRTHGGASGKTELHIMGSAKG